MKKVSYFMMILRISAALTANYSWPLDVSVFSANSKLRWFNVLVRSLEKKQHEYHKRHINAFYSILSAFGFCLILFNIINIFFFIYYEEENIFVCFVLGILFFFIMLPFYWLFENSCFQWNRTSNGNNLYIILIRWFFFVRLGNQLVTSRTVLYRFVY